MSNAVRIATWKAAFAAFGVDPETADDVARRTCHDTMLAYARACGYRPPAEAAPQRAAKAETPRRPASGSLPTTLPGYGRTANQPIATASVEDCRFYEKGCLRTLGDPSKERWHAKEQLMLEALRARLRAQGQAADHG